MHGNTYEIDPPLAGRQVDLVFDPLELTEVQVADGRDRSLAVPRVIKWHAHPTRTAHGAEAGGRSGIDYLGLIQKRREQEVLQQRGSTTAACAPQATRTTTTTTARG